MITGKIEIKGIRSLSYKKEKKSRKFIDFIVLTLFILFTASAASFLTNRFSVIVFLFLLLLFFIRRRKLDLYIIFVLGIWSLINFISFVINRPSVFPYITFIGVTMRISMSYLILKDIGPVFFDKFFRYAYVLVLVSLPLFILEQSVPSLFDFLAPIFKFMTGEEQIQAGGFYAFIYMHNGWGWQQFRNSGFIWEPGGYACLLIYLLYYYWFRKGIILDKKVIVIMVALLSTFSTAGYLSIFVALVLLIVRNKNLRKKVSIVIPILIIFLLVVGTKFYMENKFMKDKIEGYIEEGTSTYEWSFGNMSVIRVSRLGILIVALDNAVHNPLGDGVIKSKYIIKKYGNVVGPNSLAEILSQWGILGICVLFYSLYCFSMSFIRDKFCAFCFILSFGIVLLSNPSAFKYLVFILVFYIIGSYANILKKRLNKQLLSIDDSDSFLG